MIYSYAPGSAAAHARAVAELGRSQAPPPAYTVLRPAQPYDLATPGTPGGILAVAAAAREGGVWAQGATLALAEECATGDVVASLCLRLQADRWPGPGKSNHQCRRCGRWLEGEWSRAGEAERIELQRQMDAGRCDTCAAALATPRRAWVMYVRTKGGAWASSAPGGLGGAAILDPVADPERPMRPIGIEELKAVLRGRPWVPPPPRTVYSVPCPVCGQPAKLTAAGKIYASHRCEGKHTEGRS